MYKSRIVSGTVTHTESIITKFNNTEAYHTLSEKVDIVLTLDNNKIYQIDSPPEGIKIGSKINLYWDNEDKIVLIDEITAKHIKKKRFSNMLPNLILLISGGIGSLLLLAAFIITYQKEGLSYDILDALLTSSFLTIFLFFIGKQSTDAIVSPKDIRRINDLIKEEFTDEPFINISDIEKVNYSQDKNVKI